MAQNNAIGNKSSQLTIDPGASGDSYVQFDINTTNEWRLGVDDDASDAFKLSQGGTLGSNDSLVITAAGEVTRPLNPAFLGYVGSQDANVTGDGTQYTIGTNVAYTEVFDQNSDFNTNGTFTAPVTGQYLLCAQIRLGTPSGGGDNYSSNIFTSNRTHFAQNFPMQDRLANFYGSTTSLSASACCLADMDAADTAVLRITAFAGAKTSDINVGTSSTLFTFFCGYLVT